MKWRFDPFFPLKELLMNRITINTLLLLCCFPFSLYASDIDSLIASAEKGNMEAQCSLGNHYYLGIDTQQDYSKAAIWFGQAAIKGLVKCQLWISELYFTGRGVPLSKDEGFKWLSLAAGQGDIEAKYRIGMAYYLGNNASEDNFFALMWFLQAARLGHPDSIHMVGELYYLGRGIEQNEIEALSWFWLSDTAGSYMSKKYIPELEKKLNDKQKLKAKKRMAEIELSIEWK